MPKRENYDKNSQSAEAHRKQNHALGQTPERRKAQLEYRLNSIEESVAAGRQQSEEVAADVERLRKELAALEATSA